MTTPDSPPTPETPARSLLARIVAEKRAEIARGLPRPATPITHTPIDVVARLSRPKRPSTLRLVAEVKLSSPSAGPLSRVLSPADRALAYAACGAAMVSVLCDGPFFSGSFADLAAARRALHKAGAEVPLLAKEFVIDAAQIACAAAHGADAVLLIVRLLTPAELTALMAAARKHRLEPLVEVTDEAELAIAVAAKARMIGVNSRDLDTLKMDAPRAASVVAAIPAGIVAVHLSGLRDEETVAAVAGGRADAALLGEALMREDDPRPLLRRLVEAAQDH